MIWIPLADLEFPEGWAESRRKIQHELEACLAKAERSALLGEERVSAIWGALKEGLAKLSNDKCWYCETPMTRDDLVVDHYRPKGRIYEELSPVEGYWWLAVTTNNFRLACKYCNERRVDRAGGTEGGKRTHFPLLSGGVRATGDNRNTLRELPVILDPIRPRDPGLLMFLQDAWVQPIYEASDNPTNHERARLSIEILHLNHTRIRRQRGQICNLVEEAIQRAELYYRNFLERREVGDMALDAWSAYEDAFERLANFVKRTSPYAGAARSVIKQHIGPDREWLEELLTL